MLQSFGNGSLFGARHGTDTPWVLALHGWQRNHSDFDETLGGSPPLDAISLDLPGFGAAPEPNGAWGTQRYAEFISPVLEEMDQDVVVLGHSFGGLVAAQLACLVPGRIRALVVTGAPFYRPTGAQRVARRYQAIRSLSRFGLVSKRQLERARERYGSVDYRRASEVMRSVLVTRLAEDYTPVLEQITAPVELVWGADDTAAPLEFAKHAASVLGDSHLVVLADIDHFTPQHAPQALRAAIERHRR